MPLYCYAGPEPENFTVGLTNVHPLVNTPEIGNYNVCNSQFPGGLQRGATVKLHCEDTGLQPARYVIVQSLSSRLRLCELEVYTIDG